MTLLNQARATRLRDVLGEREIKRLFNERNWSSSHTGDGALLRQDKITSKGSTSCASVIEHITLPSLTRFRESLAQATGLEVPGVPAHVTLFAGGDSRGIGLADHHALQAAQVATFRLPGIANRAAPPLKEQQRAAYRAATLWPKHSPLQRGQRMVLRQAAYDAGSQREVSTKQR